MTQTLLMLLIRWLSVTLETSWGCSYITSFIKCCWDMQNKCQKYNFPFDPDVNPISYCGPYSFPKDGSPNWFTLYRPRDTSGTTKQWKSYLVGRAFRCYTFISVAITTPCLTVHIYCWHTLSDFCLPSSQAPTHFQPLLTILPWISPLHFFYEHLPRKPKRGEMFCSIRPIVQDLPCRTQNSTDVQFVTPSCLKEGWHRQICKTASLHPFPGVSAVWNHPYSLV